MAFGHACFRASRSSEQLSVIITFGPILFPRPKKEDLGNMLMNISRALIRVSVVSSLVMKIPRGNAPIGVWQTMTKTRRLNSSMFELESRKASSADVLT